MYQKNPFLLLFFLLLGFSGSFCWGQDIPKVDSLKKELERSGESNRFNVLWGLAYELFDVDNPQALTYAKQAFSFALESGDSVDIVKSGRILGQILRRVDNVDESITILTSILPTSKRFNILRETKFILNALAIAYVIKAEYDKALEFHFQSLVIREKEGDKKQISITLNNIGVVYYKLGNHELALDYYLQSLRAKEESGDTFDVDRLLINTGLCYNWLHDYSSAKEYFNRAFKLCGEACDPQIVIEGKFGIAISFYGLKQYKEAEQFHKESLQLSIENGNQRFQQENILELVRIYLVLNDLKSADDYLKMMDSMTGMMVYKENMLARYELTADFYTKSKDFEKANLFQKKYSSLKDSIYNDHVIKNLNRVQTQFAERENLAIIAAKDQVLALNKEAIAQQRVLNLLLIAVILLTSALGIVIFLNYRRARTTTAALESAKQIIEDQNFLLDGQVKEKTQELVSTNEALVKVNDELDNFIYKTSHDIRGPLASLKGMVNLAIMDVKDDKALNYLGKLDLTAEKLNTVLTRLLIVNRINHTELKPEAVEFEAIIQEILVLEMKKGVDAKIKIDYEIDPDIHLVSDREMVRLVLENLIDNAIKFFDTSQNTKSFVKILIKSMDGHVSAHVVDNGTGIGSGNRANIFQMFVRASERSETGGIGLYLAKLATEKLGGEITLISGDEKSLTEFVVKFPPDLHSVIEHRRDEKRKFEKEKEQVQTRHRSKESV